MYEVLNKWNGRTYKVLKENDNSVTLERDDGSTLVIEKKELSFNYRRKGLTK